MKKIIVLSLLALGLAFLAYQKPARCAWCPSYACFGANSCGYGCSCVTVGGEMGGRCISVEKSH